MKCPYCDKEAQWVENKEIYGKNYGKSYMCWLCKDCNAYVGCHNNTKQSKGTIADKETRAWRIKAHGVIDPLWRDGDYKRGQVYAKLNKFFGHDVHIGESDVDMCKSIIDNFDRIFEDYNV